MNEIYFDWSQRRGVVAIVVEPGKTSVPKTWPSLALMLDSLKGVPTMLVGEATFESYLLDRRIEFANRCQREGHELYTVPPRLTPRHRRAMGLKKSDENDARAIKVLGRNQTHLSRYQAPDPKKAERREIANRQLQLLRATGGKDEWAKELTTHLPSLKDQPASRVKALSDGKNYNLVKVAAVAIATQHSDNQRDFDFFSGLYAHAYPSQIRADLMHWGWAGGSTRGKLVKELDPSGETTKDVPVVPSRRVDGLTLTEYRREIRWLYRQLRDVL